MPTLIKPKKTPKRSSPLYAMIKEKRSERITTAKLAQAIVVKAAKEKRDMSAEEKEQFDKIVSDVSALDERVEALETVDDDEDDETDDDETDDDQRDDEGKDDDKKRSKKLATENIDEIMAALEKRYGLQNLQQSQSRNNPSRRQQPLRNDEKRGGESAVQFATRQRRSKQEYFDGVFEYLKHGKAGLYNARAVQADDDIVGGYLVLPEKMADKILKKVDNDLVFQRLATTVEIPDAQSLGVPSLDTDPDDAEWTTEIASIPQDSAMRMGKRQLTPAPLRKRMLVSEKFLRMAMNASFWSNDEPAAGNAGGENLILNRLAYKIAVPREKGFMTGNGVGKPLGIFVASSRGIPTSRDFSSGSTTGITYAGLLRVKFALKAQYQRKAVWLWHRDAMEKIMGLVDDNHRPLLNFSTLPDVPTTLLQHAVHQSEYVPNTFTDQSYIGMLGDPEYYMIANSQQVTVKKAEELYAETAQVGFFVSCESDGMPVLDEAWSRVKCAA